MNSIIGDRQILYYVLWTIRNPELWFERNKTAKDAKKRYETRKNLQSFIKQTGYQYCCDDQVVFVAKDELCGIEILEGEVIGTNRLGIEGDILFADFKGDRIILERRNEDGTTHQFQYTSEGWKSVRNRAKKPNDSSYNEAIQGIKDRNNAAIAEHERVLIEIRARKARLALELNGTLTNFSDSKVTR
jgi:YD repeat-containing protein